MQLQPALEPSVTLAFCLFIFAFPQSARPIACLQALQASIVALVFGVFLK